nr:MAG TPA: N-deoxyribosyltransferase [Crassvirales sp.]
MKKLFISQPMKGKTNEQIEKEREDAVNKAVALLGEEVEIIDSFFKNAPVSASPLWFLGKSLELLATADVAYFAEGWEEARGCKVEHLCATEYGIPVLTHKD